MPLGPIQFVVIGFDHPEPDGSVVTELNAMRDAGFIRLVDALGVYKDKEGAIWSVEVSDLEEDEAILAGAAIGALIGMGAAGEAGAEVGAVEGALDAEEAYLFGMAPEDIDALAENIPAGGGGLLMLIEHTWLTPLRDAIRAQGGVFLAHNFLSAEMLTGIGVELALAEEMASAALTEE